VSWEPCPRSGYPFKDAGGGEDPRDEFEEIPGEHLFCIVGRGPAKFFSLRTFLRPGGQRSLLALSLEALPGEDKLLPALGSEPQKFFEGPGVIFSKRGEN